MGVLFVLSKILLEPLKNAIEVVDCNLKYYCIWPMCRNTWKEVIIRTDRM